MLQRSTIQLLRFPFSFFLMPVFWFALSQVVQLDVARAFLAFLVLHGLVYPASNGYNSYMDRDEGPIGGLKDPAAPTKQLFVASVVMDVLAVGVSLWISPYFAAGILLYILASRAYSWRGLRLKKYPVWGYLTVVFFQGAWVYWLTRHGSSLSKPLSFPVVAMIASSLLVGGFYPLTQLYQHEQDRADGVTTLSMLLGYRGTFVFTGLIYLLAMMVLGWYFANNLELDRFFLLQTWMLPVLVYFFWWAAKVWKDPANANFKYTMRMNLLGSLCSNGAFITLFIIDHI